MTLANSNILPANELEALIRPTGFFRAKAKNLKAMAGKVVADHGGNVPPDLDDLRNVICKALKGHGNVVAPE